MKKTIVWENIETRGLEYMELTSDDKEIIVKSTIINPTNPPAKTEYRVSLNHNWTVSKLEVRNSKHGRELFISSNGSGKWFDEDRRELRHLEGAIDIDLSCTPFTNSLPINRADWKVNEPIDFEMVYIDVDDLSVRKSQQRYELIDSKSDYKIFSYTSRSFKSNIIVNHDGFVLECPKYFKLLTSV